MTRDQFNALQDYIKAEALAAVKDNSTHWFESARARDAAETIARDLLVDEDE